MRSRFIIFLGYFRTLLANRVFSFLFIAHVVIIRSMRTNRVGFLHIVEVEDAVSEGEARARGSGYGMKSLSRVAEMRQRMQRFLHSSEGKM